MTYDYFEDLNDRDELDDEDRALLEHVQEDEDFDPRERDDDDGQQYADPRDEKEEREDALDQDW